MGEEKRLADELDRKISYQGNITLIDKAKEQPITYDDLTYYGKDDLAMYLTDADQWRGYVFESERTVKYDFACTIRGFDKINGTWEQEEKDIAFKDLPDDLKEIVIDDVLRHPGRMYAMTYSDRLTDHELAAAMGDNRFEIMEPQVKIFADVDDDPRVFGRIDYKHEIDPDRYGKTHVDFIYDPETEEMDFYYSGPLGEANAPGYIYDHMDWLEPMVVDACTEHLEKQKEALREEAEQKPEKKKNASRSR